ncbi:hypothetical protein [Mucilaginibacter sp.]
MNYLKKGFIQFLVCFSVILFAVNADAQISLIENAINKLEGYKNFSYQAIEKVLDHTDETTIRQHKDTFQKTPGDVNTGYLFSRETQGKDQHIIDLYNGKNFMILSPDDRTYTYDDIKRYWMRNNTSALLCFLDG